ncbi:MAG: hypothetical protein MJZ23_09470 [Paludibacteraceae bacterium]|nr:hypothetical protein [Paludibacteraceae bacterium]
MEQTNTLPLETEKLYRKYIKQLGARFHKHYLNSINEVFGAWLTQHKKEWTLRNKKTPSLNDLLSYKPEKIKDFFKRFINVIKKLFKFNSKLI